LFDPTTRKNTADDADVVAGVVANPF